MTRAQINDALVSVAVGCGVDKAAMDAAMARKHVEGSLNTGNAATPALKKFVRYHRVRGVHVTPTVFVNGIEATEIGSSWTGDQWRDYVAAALA